MVWLLTWHVEALVLDADDVLALDLGDELDVVDAAFQVHDVTQVCLPRRIRHRSLHVERTRT